MQRNGVFLAVKEALDDVELDSEFGRAFLPESHQISGIRVPNDRGMRWDVTREKSFLEGEELSMTGRKANLFRRKGILKEES